MALNGPTDHFNELEKKMNGPGWMITSSSASQSEDELGALERDEFAFKMCQIIRRSGRNQEKRRKHHTKHEKVNYNFSTVMHSKHKSLNYRLFEISPKILQQPKLKLPQPLNFNNLMKSRIHQVVEICLNIAVAMCPWQP